jgi:glyoxylase-like metal-dependent hydrolase (beta-lactamase superfamily II)
MKSEVVMRVHHLNCISSCPLGGKLIDAGPESIVDRGHLTNHCLLIETDKELILVDTGFGLEDVRNPQSRLSEFFLKMIKPDFMEELTALRQIERMGFKADDVRHIILSNLNFDHAGGLDDFPEAKVHMLKAERDYAVLQKTWLDRQRFRPEQWGTKKNWIVYEPGDGEDWFGLTKVHSLQGLPPEIVMVPLIGHTHGHAGIGVLNKGRWLLDCGDAYFFHEEMNLENPHCTPGLEMYQTMMEKDHEARIWNQERLRELKKNYSNQIDIFCSHDVVEFKKMAGRSPEISPAPISYNNRELKPSLELSQYEMNPKHYHIH